MEALTVIFRTTLIYFVVLLIMRLMGKREIGKLSLFDLVISIMIAEAAVFVIEDTKRPIWEGILPMATLLVIQVGTSFLALKSRKLRFAFDGKPSMIINNGELMRDEMRKQRYSLDDLMAQLREQNVDDINDVQFAFLETTGKLTVILKDAAHSKGTAEPSRDEQNTISEGQKIRYESLPLPLIMDGKVQDANLEKIQKNRFWLKSQIQSKGISDFKEVFFCTIDHKGRLYLNSKQKQ